MTYKWDEMTEEERNALVSWQVFGYNIPAGEHFPPYTADMSSAWKVIEKMNPTLDGVAVSSTAGGWKCIMELHENVWIGFARTAPEAICKATLKAVGVEIE